MRAHRLAREPAFETVRQHGLDDDVADFAHVRQRILDMNGLKVRTASDRLTLSASRLLKENLHRTALTGAIEPILLIAEKSLQRGEARRLDGVGNLLGLRGCWCPGT